MKKPQSTSQKSIQRVQEIQSIAIIVLAVTTVVLISIVAVLLAQVDDHRQSIDGLYNITTGLPTSEQLKSAE